MAGDIEILKGQKQNSQMYRMCIHVDKGVEQSKLNAMIYSFSSVLKQHQIFHYGIHNNFVVYQLKI